MLRRLNYLSMFLGNLVEFEAIINLALRDTIRFSGCRAVLPLIIFPVVRKSCCPMDRDRLAYTEVIG
jgi:hypothetical protein